MFKSIVESVGFLLYFLVLFSFFCFNLNLILWKSVIEFYFRIKGMNHLIKRINELFSDC